MPGHHGAVDWRQAEPLGERRASGEGQEQGADPWAASLLGPRAGSAGRSGTCLDVDLDLQGHREVALSGLVVHRDRELLLPPRLAGSARDLAALCRKGEFRRQTGREVKVSDPGGLPAVKGVGEVLGEIGRVRGGVDSEADQGGRAALQGVAGDAGHRQRRGRCGGAGDRLVGGGEFESWMMMREFTET
eukprot:2944784-Rhodomonas_salina.1